MSDGRYEQADRSGRAGAIWHYEHTIQDDRSSGAGTARATEYATMAGVTKQFGTVAATGYVNAAGYAVPIGTTRVARFAAWGGHSSDGCYEPTVRSGINAGFDTAGVADGVRRVTRQADPAWVDIWLMGLYPFPGSSEQDSGIAEVMHSNHPGQYQLS